MFGLDQTIIVVIVLALIIGLTSVENNDIPMAIFAVVLALTANLLARLWHD